MFNPPEKEHFNLLKIASSISLKDKFQSPGNWSIEISLKFHISISENDKIKSPEKEYFNLPSTTNFSLPKIEVFQYHENSATQSPETETLQ